MKKIILRSEQLEKPYVQKILLEGNENLVWKAPRPNSDIETSIREQFNEFLYGRVCDEHLDTNLYPRLMEQNLQMGVAVNFFNSNWDPNKDITSYTNSNKLHLLFGLDILFHQQDRSMSATRHLMVNSNDNGTYTLNPIDNGFSLMHIDESKSDPNMDLETNFFNNLLASNFITSSSDIESILILIDSMDIKRTVKDIAAYFVTTCSFTPTIRTFIYCYADRVISYLEARKSNCKTAIRAWWDQKNDRKEEQGIVLTFVP